MKTHVDDVDRRNYNKPARRIKDRAREEEAMKLAEMVLAYTSNPRDIVKLLPLDAAARAFKAGAK